MMFKLWFASLCSVLLVSAATSTGCSSAERIYDCGKICNAYKDCINSDYDVTACTSRCEDKASNDKAFEDRADECQKCVDEHSCAGAVFSCTDNCVGIVP